ncbi:hypothetical protein GLYMA_10G263251v4 [Glycine max]|nr:hypothetical protein GLYMA_10G263251v4 [Glycine max]KAH1140186.1 hypothetical protein GYH30_029198 [Glycine max]
MGCLVVNFLGVSLCYGRRFGVLVCESVVGDIFRGEGPCFRYNV